MITKPAAGRRNPTLPLTPRMRRSAGKPAAYPYWRLILGIAGMIFVFAMIV